MRIKVHGGTQTDSDHSLCATCRHSRIMRGRKLDEELVLCDASHLRTTQITFKVTSCSDYSDVRLVSYYELMQQAWILQPGSRKRPAGFVRASDLAQEEFVRYLAEVRTSEDP